jgi:hypothetical protein
MSKQPIDLTGSPSYFCISQQQMTDAYTLAFEDQGSASQIQTVLDMLERQLDRNQQAALAFVLIDKLLQSAS